MEPNCRYRRSVVLTAWSQNRPRREPWCARRAGLSQVELAGQAGVKQSVISAYESGQRQPSIPALARLIDAAGFELTLGLRRSSGLLRRMSGPVDRRARRHRRELVAAVVTHGVQNPRMFGSVARGEDCPR